MLKGNCNYYSCLFYFNMLIENKMDPNKSITKMRNSAIMKTHLILTYKNPQKHRFTNLKINVHYENSFLS